MGEGAGGIGGASGAPAAEQLTRLDIPSKDERVPSRPIAAVQQPTAEPASSTFDPRAALDRFLSVMKGWPDAMAAAPNATSTDAAPAVEVVAGDIGSAELDALLHDAPRRYRPNGVGNGPANLFQPIESPGDTVDFLVDALNALGLSVEDPTGATRDVAAVGVGGLAFGSALWFINKSYTKLLLLPGSVPAIAGLPYMAYYLGLASLTRSVTDLRRAATRGEELGIGQISTEVLYASFLTWAISSPVWPLVTALQYSLSGPFQKLMNWDNTMRASYVNLGKGVLAEASPLLGRRILTESQPFKFVVDAEHLASPANVRLAGQLEAEAEVVLDGRTIKDLRSYRGMLEQVHASGAIVEVKATTVRTVKQFHPGPGDTILKGSWIRQMGSLIRLSEDMVISPPPRGFRLTDLVIHDGQVKASTVVDLHNDELLRTLARRGANVDITITGRANSVLPQVARGVAARGAVRYPGQHTIRRIFGPASMTVTLKGREGAAISGVNAEELTQLAAQSQYGVRLSTAPRVPLSAMVADYLVANPDVKYGVRVPLAVLEAAFVQDDALAFRSLRADKQLLARLPGLVEPVALTDARLLQLRREGFTHVLLAADTQQLTVVARDASHPITRMAAERQFGATLRRAVGQLRPANWGKTPAVVDLALENLPKLPGVSWKLLPVDNVAILTRPGSTVSQKEFARASRLILPDTASSLAQEILRFPGAVRQRVVVTARAAVQILSYGRVRPFTGVNIAGGMLASPVIGVMVYMEGWRDWSVILPQALRGNFTGIPNNLFAPATVATGGEAKFSAHAYFPYSITVLRVLEVFYQSAEADTKLFKQTTRLLMGEDRLAERQEYIDRLVDIETHAESSERPAMLTVRLANGVRTGYVRPPQAAVDDQAAYPGDVQTLRAMYEKGITAEGEQFAEDFLVAVQRDRALYGAIQEDPDAAAFFRQEAATRQITWQ